MAYELGTLPYPQMETQPNPLDDYVSTIRTLANNDILAPRQQQQTQPATVTTPEYVSPEGFYVPPQTLPAPQPQPVDPIWPTSNPTGTERFVDYRGYDRPYMPPKPDDNALAQALQPAPNTEYGSVVPIARDTETGETRWAMPSAARSWLQGGYDLTQGPRTGEMTPEATGTLMTLAAPDLLRTNEGGVLRTFGGPSAKTADLGALRVAQDMDSTDVYTARDIFDQTGWFKGPDGNWKFEISDQPMTRKSDFSPGPAGWSTLGEMYDHPDLFAAYPHLADVEVQTGANIPGASGSYSRPVEPGDPGQIRFASDQPDTRTAVHEIQHAVQQTEDWPRGGSPQGVMLDQSLRPQWLDEISAMNDRIRTPQSYEDYVRNAWGGKEEPETPRWYDEYVRQVTGGQHPQSPDDYTIQNEAARNVYHRLSGEVEARQSSYRTNLSDEQRRAQAPWIYDTPWSEQIIRRSPGQPNELQLSADEPPSNPLSGIRAYHGSPHSFDAFDSSRIGTGEGAQSYGHGLYFAENEGVARGYRKNLAQEHLTEKLRDSYDQGDAPDEAAQAALEHPDLTGPERDVLHALNNEDWLGFDYPHQALRAALREPENFDLSPETRAALDNLGHSYEVNIGANPEHLLDWDKPLSEQSQHVQDALNNARDAAESAAKSQPGANDILWRTHTGDEINLSALPEAERSLTQRTLEKAGYGRIQERWRHDMDANPLVFSGDPQSIVKGNNPAAQAQYLRDAGIPGIRYADQGSRDALAEADRLQGKITMMRLGGYSDAEIAREQQYLDQARQKVSRNYVVFNDRTINILRKYGIAGLMAGGAAAATGRAQQ